MNHNPAGQPEADDSIRYILVMAAGHHHGGHGERVLVEIELRISPCGDVDGLPSWHEESSPSDSDADPGVDDGDVECLILLASRMLRTKLDTGTVDGTIGEPGQ